MMNERIQKLAVQAHVYADGHSLLCHEGDIKKFAELIVREMLDITDAHTEVFQTDRDKALIEHIKQSVKQHFGVEE